MAAVGKTLLVKEVSRQVQEGKLLDSVVMAIVSSTPYIQKIQDQIAMLLVLKIEEKSTIVRGHRLCERLMNEKKVVIVLDDIWKKLDLEEVGIPFGIRRALENKSVFVWNAALRKLQRPSSEKIVEIPTNGTNEEYCDAHDLTYIVVKSIASKNNSVFTLAEEDVLRDWLDGESMKICNKICVGYAAVIQDSRGQVVKATSAGVRGWLNHEWPR
ncbi:hypothetical protein Goklo_028959 [Gossypium klotzschianum]|uniref:NB-ARC domain-containing protein n=1 Tax=Gossypium klotzschianum TaxID=34286 RepID=A0A7J8W6H0_9ROSI|nr:hypothetical protein [Gossypium klotzschianum]